MQQYIELHNAYKTMFANGEFVMETGWIYGLLLALFNGMVCFLVPAIVAASQRQKLSLATVEVAQTTRLASQEAG
ncbi:MAG: hypothetical protein ACRC8A_13060 [Microcoleaceae cyanobacterium]